MLEKTTLVGDDLPGIMTAFSGSFDGPNYYEFDFEFPGNIGVPYLVYTNIYVNGFWYK